MKEKFKTLIVEDDEVNIKLLKLLLEKYCPDIEVIDVAKNTNDFIDKFLKYKPDILLLDIDLGEHKNTLDILDDLEDIKSKIIITSSHKGYALKAINKYHVSGYILKPINSVKLINVINTAKINILEKRASKDVITDSHAGQEIIGIPSSTSIELIDTKDILYLEADGKYTVFHMINGSSKIVSKNIGHYEALLPKHYFFRIHYKYIVNLTKVTAISRSDGNYCLLTNGKSLSIANRRNESLRKFLRLK